MLLDPIATAYAATYPGPTAGTNFSFNRVDKGKFVANNGAFTSDQPARLTVIPNVKPSGISRFKVRFEMDKNLNPINGIAQQDDVGYCEILFGGNLRSFSAVDFSHMIRLCQHLTVTNIDKIVEGQS